MKLSIIIPAHNAEDSIVATLDGITAVLANGGIDYEILVVADHCVDRTAHKVCLATEHNPSIHCITSPYPSGYGHAVRAGLDTFQGDAVVIMSADGSDSPSDLLTYHRLLVAGYDCVFGSRFLRGSQTRGYPLPKLILNRVGNLGLRMLFRHGYNDTTNAFKAYQRHVIDLIQPLISAQFNLTVEMPLKAIVRGASYAVVPIDWNRQTSTGSKFHIQEAGSRYLFISLYVLFEHHLTGGDYRDPSLPGSRRGRWRAGHPSIVLRHKNVPLDA